MTSVCCYGNSDLDKTYFIWNFYVCPTNANKPTSKILLFQTCREEEDFKLANVINYCFFLLGQEQKTEVIKDELNPQWNKVTPSLPNPTVQAHLHINKNISVITDLRWNWAPSVSFCCVILWLQLL